MLGKLRSIFATQQSARSATVLLAVTLTLSNVLGIVRDHFLAQKIPTAQLDTYYAAFRIPDLLFNLLILGAITSAFLPVFIGAWRGGAGRERAWEITQSLLTITIVGTVGFSIVLIILAPWLVPLVVPKFDPARTQIVIELTRVMLLSPLLFGISYILGGILNAFKRFVAYSIAPLFYNLSIIVATILTADRFGVYGVTWGVVAGALLHMLVQLPAVVRLGFKWRFIFNLRDGAIRKIGTLMIPRVIALGGQQIVLTAFTIIGSAMTAGSIAIYNLTNNIQTAPVVILGTSFATANFTRMAELATDRDLPKLGALVERITRIIVFLLVPASVGLFILRAQVVRLILGSGHFEWEQTINAITTLAWFIPGILAQGLLPVFARTFYALHDTKTPMLMTVVSFVVMVGVALGGLSLGGGVEVLAIAYSVGSVVNVLWMLGGLIQRIPSISFGRIFTSAAMVTLVSVAMGLVMWISLRLANGTGLQIFSQTIPGAGVDTHTGIGLLAQALFASTIGGLVFIGLVKLLKLQEWRWMLHPKNSSKT